MTRLRLAGILVAVGAAPIRPTVSQSAPCPPLDSTAAWALVNRAWDNETGLHWANDSLRRVLLDLRDRDQAARADFGARMTDTVYGRQLIRLDSTLAEQMGAILERVGLPTRSLVGAKGSDAAMLIVQHNWPLQERVLALAQSLPPSEISPQAVGMLEDRVLVHHGKPQRFGTHFDLASDGRFRLAPVADTARLDARRAAAGIPPLALYVCLMEEAGMHIDRSSLPLMARP